jgi:thioredoxin-related protein
MRRIVAALVLISVSFALAACGGDSSGGAAPAAAPAAPPVAAAPAAPAVDTKSPVEVAAGEKFPTQADAVPVAVLDRLSAKQPMLILFYDSTQIVTDDVRAEVDAVMKEYRGLIDLVTYDVRAGGSADGTSADPEIQKAMEMAGLLGVKAQPYIVFVDRSGRVTGRFSGFVDQKLLEIEVLRATS